MEGLCYLIAFLTTQSDFPQPLAEQGRFVVLEGNFLDHSRYEWRASEATAAAEVAVAEVASIVGVAEEVLVVGRAVGIEVGVVDVVEEAENMTLGLRVEGQKAQSRVVGAQGERRDFAVESGHIVGVVANSLVVADEECWELVAGVGTESIVVGRQIREELAEGRAAERIADAG